MINCGKQPGRNFFIRPLNESQSGWSQSLHTSQSTPNHKIRKTLFKRVLFNLTGQIRCKGTLPLGRGAESRSFYAFVFKLFSHPVTKRNQKSGNELNIHRLISHGTGDKFLSCLFYSTSLLVVLFI
ncbi:hypothetical protein CISIN_1g043982mg [Citrus sinensis]|uniref:Uncharacterized protein n=1 Tax=Citrus sinensis TaxID=2711 RepID=A0A067DJ23_CITSI|nr:hypothetical protein CISIN_1g043982mg [Citrus sinensis]